MQVVNVNSGSGSVSLTIGDSADGMVIALFSQIRNPPTIETATFGGVAMNIVGSDIDGSNASSIGYILAADLPVAGSYTVSAGSSGARVTLLYCTGLKQQAPIDTKTSGDVLTGDQSGSTTRYVDLSLATVGDLCLFSTVSNAVTGAYTGVTQGLVDTSYNSGYTKDQTEVGALTNSVDALTAVAFESNSSGGGGSTPTIDSINTTNEVLQDTVMTCQTTDLPATEPSEWYAWYKGTPIEAVAWNGGQVQVRIASSLGLVLDEANKLVITWSNA